jgi:hypothetical protein
VSIVDVAAKVRSVVRERLADPDDGLNPHLAEACTQYGVSIRPISFAAASRQVWEASASPELVQDSSINDFPMLFLYVERETNHGLERPHTFSGNVPVVVDVWITFRSAALPKNAESYLDALSAALIATFNEEDYFYGTGVFWGGGCDIARRPLVMAGENWVTGAVFRGGFRIDV